MFNGKFCVYEKINEFFCLFNFYSLPLHQGYALTAYSVAFLGTQFLDRGKPLYFHWRIATTASYVFFTTRVAVV